MKNFFYFIFILFLFLPISMFSQTRETVDSLEEKCQACLDKGEFMLGCSYRFYGQMDSLMNQVYNNIRARLDSSGNATLKKEQKDWLKKRDQFFRKTNAEVEKKKKEYGYTPQDDLMTMYEDNARYVQDRIIELLKKQ